MALYKVRLTRSAEKELSALPVPLPGIVWQRIKALAEEPRSIQTKKLKGVMNAYRLRVRTYRIVYVINDNEYLVTVTSIRHRKDVYR